MSAALSTAHDVYEALGIRRHDPASLRQHFYRTTECGAWAEIVEETVPAERKRGTWTAHLSRGVGARYWTLERIDYGSKSSVKPEVYLMAPPEVRDFIKIEVQELNERATTGSLGVGLDGERMSASYDLTWTETKVEKFFRIGCVVEGSDKEVGPYTIHLPTTLGAIEETVELVESEAEVMWQEIRGGDAVKCAMNFAREKLASVFEQFELGEENQSEHIDEIDDGYWIHASVYVPKMVDVGSVEDLVLRAEAVFKEWGSGRRGHRHRHERGVVHQQPGHRGAGQEAHGGERHWMVQGNGRKPGEEGMEGEGVMRVKRLGAIALGSSQEIDVFVTDQIIDEQPAIEIVSTGKLHYMEPRAKYYWSKFELEVEKAAWAPVALAMLAAYLRTGTELAKALAEYRDELEPILEEYRDMVRADLDDARGTDSIFYKLALVIRAREKRSCGSTTCSESRAVKAGP